MKTIILTTLCCIAFTVVFCQKKTKNSAQVNAPGSSVACNCPLNQSNTFANMWKDPSKKDYVLELQVVNTLIATCPLQLDSLFFLQRIDAPSSFNRKYGFSEFTKIYEKTSSDLKSYTVRFKIPQSIFIDRLFEGRDVFALVTHRFGFKKCDVSLNFKITEALL
jgi:hypothetical protein